MREGKLFVIGTPIGNLNDITDRAIATLAAVEVLVCEDTRVASKLVNALASAGKLTRVPRYLPYNDYNEKERSSDVVDLVASGSLVGLVSDAGMPTLSDPGYRVIRECYDRGLAVEIIPGVDSVTTALAASGLGGQRFFFQGYLHKKSGKREREVLAIGTLLTDFPAIRVVIFLTPHRVAKDLAALISGLGGVHRGVIMREMTKRHEERLEGTLADLLKVAEGRSLKGEMVLVLEQ